MKSKCLNFLQKHWFFISIVLIFILKLYLVNIQPIQIKNYTHDDGFFLFSAKSILDGKWLGPYNDVILSKGVFGILFIALMHFLKIPFLMGEQIFLFLAILSLIIMLKNIISNKLILLMIYIILLFNPFTYSDTFSFVYRDGIYPSLIIMFVAFSFLIFFKRKLEIKKLIIPCILFGLTYAAIYLTREETFWLTPYIICAFIITALFIFKDKKIKDKVPKLTVITLIPLVCSLIPILTVCTINYYYYGRFITNDITSSDFENAYGALTRVLPQNHVNRYPLVKKSREELYGLSSKFKELENFLENNTKYLDNGDYLEGKLCWAIREGVYILGYYENANTAKQYYEDLAAEINELCDTKTIKCLDSHSSLIAPIKKDAILELKKYIPAAFIVQATYDNMDVRIPVIKPLDNNFLQMTYNQYTYTSKQLHSWRLGIMEYILFLFQKVNPYFLIISIICYIILMIMAFFNHFRYYNEIILINALLMLYLIRVISIGFIAATQYSSAIGKAQYLGPSYLIQSLFSILVILTLIKNFKEYRKY